MHRLPTNLNRTRRSVLGTLYLYDRSGRARTTFNGNASRYHRHFIQRQKRLRNIQLIYQRDNLCPLLLRSNYNFKYVRRPRRGTTPTILLRLLRKTFRRRFTIIRSTRLVRRLLSLTRRITQSRRNNSNNLKRKDGRATRFLGTYQIRAVHEFIRSRRFKTTRRHRNGTRPLLRTGKVLPRLPIDIFNRIRSLRRPKSILSIRIFRIDRSKGVFPNNRIRMAKKKFSRTTNLPRRNGTIYFIRNIPRRFRTTTNKICGPRRRLRDNKFTHAIKTWGTMGATLQSDRIRVVRRQATVMTFTGNVNLSREFRG